MDEKRDKTKTQESCEVTFKLEGNLPMFVHLTGFIRNNYNQCLINVSDITERKLAEKIILDMNASLDQKIKERTLQLSSANKKLEQDITERKRIEEKLRWNKSFLELMSNSSPLGFLVVDNRTDEILHFNHRFCQIWGIDHVEDQMYRGELKNNDIIPYCLPVLADIPAFAESCKPLQDEENRIILEDEIAFTDNRTVRRFSTQIRGENDEYYGRFYIFEEITKRKHTEKALRESEARFSSFMAYLPAVVFLKDHAGRTLFVNKYMESAFGASEWMGKTMKEVFPNELGEKLLSDDIGSMQLGYQKLEESLVQLDGKLHHYETQKFTIDRPGLEPWLGGISLDITERKQAEEKINQARNEAVKANLAKSEFLSRMSHELRTPMNSILGFAQLIKMGDLSQKQKKSADHILTSGKHLLNLIDEVLDISCIEAGRLSLFPEPVQLNSIIAEMMEVIQPLTFARELNLELENSLANLHFVMADRKRLKQVLMNLFSNAVKYNRQGGSIWVKTETIPQNDKGVVSVRISVKDTGLGITPDDIAKLFLPFERIGAERTQTEGAGLGLAIVKRLIDAMEGTVGVESVVGQGSTFWIELPITEDIISWKEQQADNEKLTKKLRTTETELAFQNEEKAKPANELVILKQEYALYDHGEPKPETAITAKTRTIFYIEDNLPSIELIEGILEKHRPEINLISTRFGKNAVRLATDNMPDLLLLDLDLPDMHGSEVLTNLLADAKTKSIPVVILTADAMRQQIEKLLTAGASDYLTKPIDIIMFLQVIDEWVGKQTK